MKDPRDNFLAPMNTAQLAPESAPANPLVRLFRTTWHYWVMVVYTLVYHFPLLLPRIGMPPWGDFYSYYSPLRVFGALRLRAGQMPFLTDGLFGGFQIYADPPMGLFYPINLLYSLFMPAPDSHAAFDYYILINLLVLSLSALYLARALRLSRPAAVLAAIIMSMNGFIQMHITHIGIIQVIAATYVAGGLLAKLAWGGGRDWRLAIWAGLWLGIGNLVGHPQTTMFGDYALGICTLAAAIMVWQRNRDALAIVRTLSWSLVAVILSVLLAAIELLPTAALLSVSYKMGMTREIAMGEAIMPRHLPSMLFPGYYWALPWNTSWPLYARTWPHWMCENPLEGLTFLGLTAFGLGIAGFLSYWRKWQAHLLFWSALFLILASLGPYTPVYGWMYDYLPAVKVVRVPSRVLWLFYTAWALLAALGLEAAFKKAPRLRQRTAALAGLASIAAILVLPAAVLFYYFRDKTGWLEAFISALIPRHDLYDDLVKENLGLFVIAITKQTLFGLAFLAATLFCLWLFSRPAPRRRAFVITSIVLVAGELFLYGFGRSYEINLPTYEHIHSPALDAIPGKPTGRVVMPHFVHGGDGMNVAAYNGMQLAGGYSPSAAKWPYYTIPLDVPPWQITPAGTCRDGKLFDLWNVSDIVIDRRSREVTIGDLKAPVEDWGWTTLISPAAGATTGPASICPDSYRVALDPATTQPISALYLISASTQSASLPNGTPIATLHAIPADPAATTITLPIRAGRETSDIDYETLASDAATRPAHDKITLAYTRDAAWQWTDGYPLYLGIIHLPEATPLKQIIVEANGPHPSGLALSQITLATSDSLHTIVPLEQYGFKEIPSRDPKYRILRRPAPTSEASVVPQAMVSSYKQIEYVIDRITSPALDLRRTVIVDKNKYSADEARALSAPSPAAFESSATLQRLQPEHLIIKATANQPGWLVVQVAWDAGWTATLNGQPAELQHANGPFITIPIPAGSHALEMKYTPVNFWTGTAITLLTLLAMMLTPWYIPRLLRRFHTPFPGKAPNE